MPVLDLTSSSPAKNRPSSSTQTARKPNCELHCAMHSPGHNSGELRPGQQSQAQPFGGLVACQLPGGLACIRTVVLHQNTLSPFPRTQRNAMQRHESSLTLLYSNRRTNRSLCGKEGRSTGPTQAAADPDILSKIMRRRCPTQTGFCLTALIGLRNCYSHRHNGVRSSRDPPRLSFTMCHARPLNNFLMNVGNH